jgi:hypothetical protein
VVRCRGRGKTVCARGARSAASAATEELDPISVRPCASAGRSASLLEGMHSSVAPSNRCTSALAFAVLLPALALAQAPSSPKSDVSMLLWNSSGPFVTSEFAKKLGVLVMEQKYARVRFEAASPTVLDKGDTWWVTFTVTQWPKDMERLQPLLPRQLTLLIRKSDAAVLGVH